MKKKVFSSLFTCGGGADQGARQAGLANAFGIEIDPNASAIANLNGFNTQVADVTKVDFSQLPSPDWLHASPPCTRASVANPNKGQAEIDVNMAEAVSRAIETLQPDYFSLENVRGYATFGDCLGPIFTALRTNRYRITTAVIDFANYGIPQNRERYVLLASKVTKPKFPNITHANGLAGQCSVFGGQPLAEHNSWYDAINNATLEPVKLTERMVECVPDWISQVNPALATGFHQYVGRGRSGLTIRKYWQPSPTLLSNMQQPTMRPHVLTRGYSGHVYAYVLSLEHMAALQTFPFDYKWGNKLTAAYSAIGNAVSPRMMQLIIEANLPDLKNDNSNSGRTKNNEIAHQLARK